jgi:hypothetical protein
MFLVSIAILLSETSFDYLLPIMLSFVYYYLLWLFVAYLIITLIKTLLHLLRHFLVLNIKECNVMHT